MNDQDRPDVDLPKDLVILMGAFRALDDTRNGLLSGAQRGVLAIIEKGWPGAWATWFMEGALLPRSVKAMERRILGT